MSCIYGIEQTCDECRMCTEKKEHEKVKVTEAEIVVHGTVEKPYFEIKYLEVGKKEHNVGYGSYSLEYVFQWLNEEFEIVKEKGNESLDIKGNYTSGNKDDLTKAVRGLDIFTKNWCMNCSKTEETNELTFNCRKCGFLKENDRCMVKEFANNCKHDYPMENFGSMGSL